MLDNLKKASLRLLYSMDLVVLLSIALIIAFCLTSLTAYFFPIYPDEIQVRLTLSRFVYDFPEKISGAPTCISTFIQPILLTQYIPGFINWALHGHLKSFYALRHVGFIIASFWILGCALYLNLQVKASLKNDKGGTNYRHQGLYITGLIISIFAVGVFPIFLITNRGEQLIFPSVMALIFIFIISRRLESESHLWKKLGLVVIYFVAISLILYGHGKGLFLTPFFLIVGWQIFRCFKTVLPFVCAMILLMLHIVQAYITWKYAFQCNEVPDINTALKSFSIDPALLFYAPSHFFDLAYQSLMQFPKYLDQLGFQEITDANYLPSFVLGPAAKFVNIFIKINVTAFFFTALIFLPVHYYRKDILSGQFVTVNLLLLALFVGVLMSAVFNIPKNWYDAGYVYAIISIIMIFFIGDNLNHILLKPIGRKVFFYLGVIALLSQMVFVHRYFPAFINGYAGPSISIAHYDSKSASNDLDAISKICSIDKINSKRVVIDDYTYLYFQKTKWPMAITYIFYQNDSDNIRRFFTDTDSSGVAVRCGSLPRSFMPYSQKVGDVCCIARSEMKKLPLP